MLTTVSDYKGHDEEKDLCVPSDVKGQGKRSGTLIKTGYPTLFFLHSHIGFSFVN